MNSKKKKGNNCNNNNNKEKQKRGKREIGTKKKLYCFSDTNKRRRFKNRKENLPDKVYREVFCFRISETKQ